MTERSAIFGTMDEAMRFIARDRSGQTARPAMAKKAGDRLYGGDEVSLAGESGAAQRGLLELALKDIDRLHLHVVLARYMSRSIPCECCGQMRVSPMWWAQVQTISNASLQLGVISSHTMMRSARDGAVARYFGHKVGLAELAENAEISLRTMNTLHGKICKWLGGSRVEKNGDPGVIGVEQVALAEVETRLLRAGHIAKTKYV